MLSTGQVVRCCRWRLLSRAREGVSRCASTASIVYVDRARHSLGLRVKSVSGFKHLSYSGFIGSKLSPPAASVMTLLVRCVACPGCNCAPHFPETRTHIRLSTVSYCTVAYCIASIRTNRIGLYHMAPYGIGLQTSSLTYARKAYVPRAHYVCDHALIIECTCWHPALGGVSNAAASNLIPTRAAKLGL